MVVYQKRSRRKITGGSYKIAEKKRLSNIGEAPTYTKIGERKIKLKREKGGKLKNTLLSVNKINVTDPKTKKTQQTEILNIMESPASRHFIRRGIITKGSILETKLGKVRVTSRPGQEATISGVLIS